MAILGTELPLEEAMAPPLAQFRHCVGAPLAKSLEKSEPPFPEKRERQIGLERMGEGKMLNKACQLKKATLGNGNNANWE